MVAAAAAVVAAGTVASTAISSSGSKKASNNAADIARLETELARDQFTFQRDLANRQVALADEARGQTNPIRLRVLQALEQYLGVPAAGDNGMLKPGAVELPGTGSGGGTASAGQLPPGLVPAYEPFSATFAPVRDTLEAQYTVARRNLIENAPVRSGALGTNLANLEVARAQNLGQATRDEALLGRQARERYLYGVEAPARTALFGRATEIATGQPTQQFSGLTGAAATSAAGAPTLAQAGQLSATLAGQAAQQGQAQGQALGGGGRHSSPRISRRRGNREPAGRVSGAMGPRA